MNKIVFTEEFCQPERLQPFTLTRQIQDIRVGILTIREKWEHWLGLHSFDKKEDDYKDLKQSVHLDIVTGDKDVCFLIHSNLLPTQKLVRAIKKLKDGEFLKTPNDIGIVFRITKNEIKGRHKIKVGKAILFSEPISTINYPWDIFQLNSQEIQSDFVLLTKGRKSAPISKSNRVTNAAQVFIEKGAIVEYSIINARTGPVYVGKNAEVMEGAIIRGPFAMGEGACLKMGSKVYGATTLGPYCIGGGEIKNTVMFGFSNKAHDGYLGDSVVGEWCNMGAGTTNSNLKNNAGAICIWTADGEKTIGNKCGVMMGDYSRTAINTSINTGTVIGVCCNVFGTGLLPKYIPNFSWGSDAMKRYELEKVVSDIENWKNLKKMKLTEDEIKILKYVYKHF